jgi:prepilin-type N-terminal cleavage/methylation domain-containing protein
MKRRAFTLIELAIVIGIMTVIAAMLFPALAGQGKRNQIEATRAMLGTIAAGIERINPPVLRVDGNTALRDRWDFNGDGLLDGDPAQDPGFTAADRMAASTARYQGTMAELGTIGIGARFIDARTGRIRDAWAQPIRIIFDAQRFGTVGVGIYSIGPDGIDAAGENDDITSW